MQRFLATLSFLGVAVGIDIVLIITTVGVSCYRHGDRGPYPELEWLCWYAPMASATVAYLLLWRKEGVSQ